MRIVTAAVVEAEGKVLIARRRSGGMQAGKWEFPGGKLEPGETPEECLARELLEEFGIEAEIGEFVGSSVYRYDHGAIELLAYRVARVSGEFTLHDHDEIRWVRPAQLNAFDFAPADWPIVRRLMEQVSSQLRGE